MHYHIKSFSLFSDVSKKIVLYVTMGKQIYWWIMKKKKISCSENFLLVYNWWVKILQIMFCSSPIQSLLIKNLLIFDTTSFLLFICYSLLSLFLYLFISRVPPWALNTVELTDSGLPDRKQLVSVRLNSLRPKAAKTTLCLRLLKEAIWSCSCAHHKLVQ